MNYASVRTCDIANGEGVRVSLFVSGCTHRCKGCFNAEAQAFDYGQPFTAAVADEVLAALKPAHIAGLTLLGGEPMEPENQRALVPFLRRFHAVYGATKTLWVYTGCVLEELQTPTRWRTEVTDEFLALTDVLVDGPFIEAQKDISLRFRGSSNQRILKLHPRLAITGGIACGKSQVARYLREAGLETLDADDVVHELVPAEERKRLAAVVFADPAKRRELEARLHPIVKERLTRFMSEGTLSVGAPLRVVIVPLLFETHWDAEYDIICCVSSEREVQIFRLMTTRGYSRAEAEARLAAQMPVAEKAAKSQYVIENNGSVDALKKKTEEFVLWLKSSTYSQIQ